MSAKTQACCPNANTKQETETTEIIDDKLSLLIAAGAAMASNCEPCLDEVIPELIEAGVPGEHIRGALEIGQTVKDKPAGLMKEAADALAGTSLAKQPASEECPAERLEKDANYQAVMLISAGAAMAAKCEPCLNQVIPNLIEARVGDADIRKAVEIGQAVKDRAAALMKEAADTLAGTSLSAQSSEEFSAAAANASGCSCG